MLLIPALSGPAAAQASPAAAVEAGPAAAIQALLSTPDVSRAHWGISVVDAATGARLYARDDGELFEPASNAKLLTTAAALAVLGPEYTIKTTVTAEGEIDASGVLHGVLRVNGAGDPTLSGRVYPYAAKTERTAMPLAALDALAAQVAASGIRTVAGRAGVAVIGDDTLFAYERYGAGWAWDDLQWEYGAPVSALTVNDNVRFLSVQPGQHAGDPVHVAWAPELPAVADRNGLLTLSDTSAGAPGAGNLLNAATTAPAGTEQHLGLSREPDSPALRLYGALPAGAKPASLAVALRDPAEFTAWAFGAALRAHGVAVLGETEAEHRPSVDTRSFAAEVREPAVLHPGTPGSSSAGPDRVVAGPDRVVAGPDRVVAGRVVATRTSPPLRDIVTVVNKVSQNLHAELLLRLLGRAAGDDGSAAQGIRVVRSFLVQAGVDPDDIVLSDGSGLSSSDLVTPRALTTLLVYAARQPWGGVFRASLPVGGVDGSLAGRFTQPVSGGVTLKGKVQAKTGTLGEVNALSGYLTAASGRQLVFSVLVNDRVGDPARVAMDKIVAAIAAAY